MSCWETLLVPEKNICFDAKWKPRHIFKLHAFSKVGAWEVQGPLLEEWLSVLPELIRIANEQNIREQLVLKKQHHAASVLPVWSLFLVGRKARHDILTPTIVALHNDIEVAKRASTAFKELQDGLLSVLSKGYSFHHAEYTIKLCADSVGSLNGNPPEENSFRRSLCGAHVIIRSMSITDDTGELSQAHSTIGATIGIDEKAYAITTAHAFPRSRTIPGTTGELEVYLHDPQDDRSDKNDSDSSETPTGDRLINPTRIVYAGSENGIILRSSDDIALIPIVKESFVTDNVIGLADGEHFHDQGVTSKRPQGP